MKQQQMLFEDEWIILVLGSALPCNWSSSAKNWNKLSTQRKYSRQSFINNAWLINFHVTCATRIMFKLGHTPDISPMHFQTQELSNWQTAFGGALEFMFSKCKSTLDLQGLNALCTWSGLPKRAIHASTQWPILSVQDSLFKNILRHLFLYCPSR